MLALLAALTFGAATEANAQYPDKPIRWTIAEMGLPGYEGPARPTSPRSFSATASIRSAEPRRNLVQ